MRQVKLEARHFQFIADVIRKMDGSDAYRAEIAKDFVPALKASNPKFDKDKFLDACKKSV